MNILKFIATAICLVCALSNSHAGQADWQKDWEQTLAAAKKEGQVSIYIYRYEGLLQDFKKDFPEINVVAVSGRGNELTNRIMAERRAGKYIIDVYSGGTNSLYNTLYKGKALDPFKPLLVLPEVTDVSKWWGKEHRYADPEAKYIFSYIGSPSNSQLAYNTKLVNGKEFNSYWDVTNPKWKGKIVSLDPRDTGLGNDARIKVVPLRRETASRFQ
jgi:iron(III) transport system substrate-binding protein